MPVRRTTLMLDAKLRLMFVLLLVLGCYAAAATVRASALSVGASLKATVYQGVASISPDGTTLMELGNLGQDIAGTGDLYLRPGSLQETLGAKVTKNGTTADLLVGSLCLYGSGSEVCQYGVPSGGSGDTFWKTVTKSASYTVLSPTNTDTGVSVGTWASPINGRALEVYANTTNAAVVVDGAFATQVPNWSSGVYQGGGNVLVNGNLLVIDPTAGDAYDNGGLTTYYADYASNYTPWSSVNDGATSGLDADTFDGASSLNFPHNSPIDVFWKSFVAGYNVTHVCSGGSRNGYSCVPGVVGQCPGTGTHCIDVSTPDNYQAMCVHTTVPSGTSICDGGVNAGKVCTGPGAVTCPGANCGELCSSVQATCPADPVSGFGYCANGVGNTTLCTSDADCTGSSPFISTCILGREIPEGSSSYDCGGAGAWDVCANDCRMWNQACDGSGSGACSSIGGSQVYSSTGVPILYFGSFCGPNQSGIGYHFGCDCRLTQPVPYLKAAPGQPGGDLCTKLFH